MDSIVMPRKFLAHDTLWMTNHAKWRRASWSHTQSYRQRYDGLRQWRMAWTRGELCVTGAFWCRTAT